MAVFVPKRSFFHHLGTKQGFFVPILTAPSSSLFGDALVDYCYSLDTEEHPIPWLLYMTFNGDRKYMWDYSFKERYARVLNYLAVKENRTIFNSLTPESVEALRKEKREKVNNLPSYHR